MTDFADVFIGVDIGGTKIAGGLVNTCGEIMYKTRHRMHAAGTAAEGVAAVRAAIDAILRDNPDANVSGIGLSSPGFVNPETGMIIASANLPCWRDFPLCSTIEQIYHLPCRLQNDANAAGLAEARWGAGSAHEYVFYTCIGTGVGTAFLCGGRLYRGCTGAAGEGGHMTIDYGGEKCRCGKAGCIETLAAGPAIAMRARCKAIAAPDRAARILEIAGDFSQITSEMVAQAWQEGDPLATEVLKETADLLAIWFGNIVDLLEPDVIVVGGGVGVLISRWSGRILSQLQSWSLNARSHDIRLVQAKYGADSGIVGAAAVCFGHRETAVPVAGERRLLRAHA